MTSHYGMLDGKVISFQTRIILYRLLESLFVQVVFGNMQRPYN